jgi:AcrR family transcriptional regulator
MNDPQQRRSSHGPTITSTRDDLLDAARRCVRDGGLAGATSREIAAAAGANLGAITYHFGSKDDLIAEALFGEIERRVTPALILLDQEGESTELMLEAVRSLLSEFERSKKDTLVYLEALLLATRDARYRRSALAVYRSIRTRLAEVISDLRSDGPVPGWVDPDAMASLILSVANGIALQTRLDPTGPDHTAMAGQFALLLVGVSNG